MINEIDLYKNRLEILVNIRDKVINKELFGYNPNSVSENRIYEISSVDAPIAINEILYKLKLTDEPDNYHAHPIGNSLIETYRQENAPIFYAAFNTHFKSGNVDTALLKLGTLAEEMKSCLQTLKTEYECVQ